MNVSIVAFMLGLLTFFMRNVWSLKAPSQQAQIIQKHVEETKKMMIASDLIPQEKEQKETDYVWYLAYGSNLNPSTMERRKAYPKESLACKVPTHKLVFTCPGIPYVEPCFASIEAIEQCKEKDKTSEMKQKNDQYLHGVAHLITNQEFNEILRSEGGGGYENLGYNVISVNVTTYSGKRIECLTLLWDTSSNTKCKERSLDTVRPSKRYWNLLVEGSEYYGLDAKYQMWLRESVPYYNGPETFGSRVGRGITLVVGAIAFTPLVLIRLIFRKVGLFPPRWVFAATRSAFNSLFVLHDFILKYLFGSGTK